MLSIAVIGCGAIGASVLELLHGDANVRVSTLLVSGAKAAQAQAVLDRFAPDARIAQSLDGLDDFPPDLLVECAGHTAIAQHVLDRKSVV